MPGRLVAGDVRCAMPAAQALTGLSNTLTVASPMLLAQEVYGGGRLKGRARTSIVRGLPRYDLAGVDAISLNAMSASGGAALVVEPLADFLAAQRMLILVARLLTALRSDEGAALTQAGFRGPVAFAETWPPSSAGDTRASQGFYIYPLLSVPPYSTAGVSDPAAMAARSYETSPVAPLLNVMFEFDSISLSAPLRNYEHASLVLDTSPTRAGTAWFAPSSNPLWLKGLYNDVCIAVRTCAPQGQLADNLVDAILNGFINLTSRCDDRNLGVMPYSYPGVESRSFSTSPVSRSRLASLALTLAFRPSCRTGVCKHCGRAFIDPIKGRERQFCSPSCRTACYVKAKGTAYFDALTQGWWQVPDETSEGDEEPVQGWELPIQQCSGMN